MRMRLICDYCGKHYESYQCGKYNHFCSIECRRKGAKLMSANITDEDRKRRSDQIIRVNRTINNTQEKVEKRRLSLIESSEADSKSYRKFFGRHEHRVVMEQIVGRSLKSDEIVHHIDGNKRNNDPSNLLLMNQKDHIRLHLEQGGGKL